MFYLCNINKVKNNVSYETKLNVKILKYIIMRINYKFQVQVSLDGFTFYLDKSIDIELSTLDNLGSLPFIKNLIDKVQTIYSAYTNLSFEKLSKDLDYIDLNFLLFLRTIEISNFDNIKFDGEPVTLVGRTGNDFTFRFTVKEG